MADETEAAEVVDWVDWRKARARLILLKDLEDDILPLDEDIWSTEEAWDHYQNYPEFALIPFSQFKERLKGHREQVKKKKTHIQAQVAALQHDRAMHPESLFNRRGEKVFAFSSAKPMLEQDVADEKHLETSVEALYLSRPEYHGDVWTLPIFRKRLAQEIARQKFFYYLQCKRAKKEANFDSSNHRNGNADNDNDDIPGFESFENEDEV